MIVNPDVSVIVPVYNAATYLEQCIESLLQQTLAPIEVIAVNDGSTDESGTILDRLANADKRLKVVHTKNRGVSAARNVGLMMACGAYIAFCDADDWMESNMLEEMQHALIVSKSDWAICNVMLIQECKPSILRLSLQGGIKNIEEGRSLFICDTMRFIYDNANWNKLYVAEIIRDHKLNFNTEMYIYEDLLFNLKYIQFARRVSIIAKPLYNYRIQANSLCRSDIKNTVEQFNLLFKEYLSFAKTYSHASEIEIFRIEMGRTAYYQNLYLLEKMLLSEKASFCRNIKKIKEELCKVDPLIFYYSTSPLKGIQGLKKWLLQNGKYNLFAIITAFKQWLRLTN